MKNIIIFVLGITFLNLSFADPKKARTISQANSKCTVKVSAGEYPQYVVYKDRTPIFSPNTDGIESALFSESGKYIALSAGEVNLIDIEKDNFEFGMVVVNCETGKYKGYRKGQVTHVTKWQGDQGVLTSDNIIFSANADIRYRNFDT